MRFTVLHADRLYTIAADDPVVAAADRTPLADAITLLAEAGRLRAEAVEEQEAARLRGHDEGRAAGLQEGRDAAAAEHRAELFRLAMRDSEDRRARQAEISTLALEVVRRIADELGSDTVVAGIAARAARDLAPDTAAVVRVAPANAAAVTGRLAGMAGIAVEADPALPATDCVVETALGRTHAGLDTQLAQIAAIWSGKDDG